MPDMLPISVPGVAPVAHFPPKVHHPMRSEKFGKVPDVGDPNLNIE